jgi:SEC-C motif domain protein
MKNVKDCPCHSGASYSACCKPFHERSTHPLAPELLMRSRYSAFALGLGSYLSETLAQSHPDREVDPATFARSIQESYRHQRFLALR